MLVLGDFAVGDTVFCYFPMFDSNGGSITITGLAVTDIEIYKDGAPTTRSSDNGYTLLDTDGTDFAGHVGIHGFKIDLSDNSDAGFYAADSHYAAVVDSITADGQTVRFPYTFTIGKLLRPTTAGRTFNVTANGTGGVNWGDVENPENETDLINTLIQTVDGNVTGSVGSVGAGGIVAATFGAGAINAAAIAADAITAAKLATGALTADAFAADALIAATFATGAFTADAFAANALVAGTFAASSLNDKGNWNTVTPDAAGVAPTAGEIKTAIEAGGSSLAQILADSGELQTNQGNWLTATGFSTHNAAAVIAALPNIYTADIQLTIDEANTRDEYTVTWYKNGVRITSGITVPKIQVVKRVNGTDLIAVTDMTQIGSTGSYRYDEDTNRTTAGQAAVALVTATIDTGSRAFSKVCTRDSSA